MLLAFPESVRRAETRSRELLSLSEDLQMERASLGAWDFLGERFPDAHRIAVLCGPGANGGDGLALARHAVLAGAEARFAFPGGPPRAGSLAAVQLERLERLGARPEPDWRAVLADADLAVDALFGIGLSRPLDGIWVEVVEALSAVPTLSLDLPSGLDGRLGRPRGAAVRAAATATFARAKPGLLLDPGREFAGTVRVVDIGVPPACWDGEPAIEALDAPWARGRLPSRARGAHKGLAGRLVLWAGSPDYFGAAVLATSAALRSGAGLLLLGSDAGTASRIATIVPEAMGRVAVGPGALPWETLLAGADAVVAGPGIGTSPEARSTLGALLEAWSGPLVLDADALNLLARERALSDRVRSRVLPAVLLPHPGEAARLLGSSVPEVLEDPLASVRELSERFSAVAVLKGATPLAAAPDGRLALGVAGHSGMAVGGCGDALAGAVGARLAEGDEPFLAARLALRAHARAGDLAGAAGSRGMSVTDLVAKLPAAWEEMERF